MVNGIGVLATIASVLLSISPIQDVRDIYRTCAVAERSIFPYCMMMLNGASWVLVVLIGDETIGIINVFGFLAGLVYSIVYLTAACRDAARENVHRVASRLFLGTLVVIALTSLVGVVLAGRGSRKSAVDHIVYVAYLFDVMLYASPLVLFLKVLRSGKTSGMYLPLSLAITGTAVLKAAYAYQISFWLFGVPQFIGVFLGLVQLLLFLRFGVADNNEPYETIPLIADASMWWAS